VYPFITNLALYWPIVPFVLYFTTNIHLHRVALVSHSLSTIFHVEFFSLIHSFLSHGSSPMLTFRKSQQSYLWLWRWVDFIRARHVGTPIATQLSALWSWVWCTPSWCTPSWCTIDLHGASCLHGNGNNIQDWELRYQPELRRKIKNYFIDNNSTNYILVTSICNNQTP